MIYCGDSLDNLENCFQILSEQMSPCCKIINFTSDPQDWIGQIILIENQQPVNRTCEWNIVTKYYKATVQLHFLDAEDVLEDEDSVQFDDTEAVIFSCTNSMLCLEKSDQLWKSIQKHCPAVCLYVVGDRSTSASSDPEASRAEILNWCLSNSFELIDRHEEVDESDKSDLDEPDVKERIVAALKAHTWSNLQLVDENRSTKSSNVLESSLENLSLGGKDLNFEDLFSQFSKLKETSKHLPENERKDFAAKVALAFLNCVGEDEEYDED